MSFIIGGGAVFIAAMAKDPKFTQALGNSQVSPGFLVAIYAVLGVVIALIAALRMVAGIMTLYKRGRILTLTSAVVCLASVFTCYCSLTSIAVAIYTLVVLVQPSVIAEYERIRQER